MKLTNYEEALLTSVENPNVAKLIRDLADMNTRLASALTNLLNIANYAQVDYQVKILNDAHNAINTYNSKHELGV